MEQLVEPSDRRTAVMLAHALSTTLAVLLGVAVMRSWQTGEQPVASTAMAAVMGLCYAMTAVSAPRRRGHAWLVALLVLWGLGCMLSAGFVWVAFGLYFVVLHVVPRPWAGVLVAVMACWSVLVSQTVLGPVIGALAAVLTWMLISAQRKDTKAYRELLGELRQAQASLAETERARGVLAERERLAREIHDTIGQGLASIVVLARTARAGDADALDLIEDTARSNLAEARRFIRDLGAPGEVGLVEGLRSVASAAQRQAAASGQALHVEVTSDGQPRPLSPEVVATLHRGVQASLANVLQHAAASRCVVGVSWFDDEVVVDVVDDGRGFDVHRIGPDSFGMRGLRQRMAEVGGAVTFDTVPGEGTTVALTAPVAPQSPDDGANEHETEQQAEEGR